MKNALFVFVLITIIAIISGGVFNAIVIDSNASTVSSNGIRTITSYSCRPNSSGVLLTVEHDGHLFVVEGYQQKGAILHHPDCPCMSLRKVEK